MKLVDVFGSKMYRHLEGLSFEDPVVCDVPEASVLKSGDEILDVIFSPDPVTGLPSGSLSMYLSDKTNDEVRSYIEKNLLFDTSSSAVTSSPEVYSKFRNEIQGLQSDFIARCSRNRFESLQDYERRIMRELDTMRNDDLMRQRVESIRRRMEKNDKDSSDKDSFND